MGKSMVNFVIKVNTQQLLGIIKLAKKLGNQCLLSVRTAATINKVKDLVNRRSRADGQKHFKQILDLLDNFLCRSDQ